MCKIHESLFEALIARDLALARGARGGALRDLEDLPVREIELVEQGRSAHRLERPARGEQPVGLGAPEVHGAPALLRLDSPEVRAAGLGLNRLDLRDLAELGQI